MEKGNSVDSYQYFIILLGTVHWLFNLLKRHFQRHRVLAIKRFLSGINQRCFIVFCNKKASIHHDTLRTKTIIANFLQK